MEAILLQPFFALGCLQVICDDNLGFSDIKKMNCEFFVVSGCLII